MVKFLTASLACLYATGHLGYYLGTLRGEAKFAPRSPPGDHQSSEPAESSQDRLVRLSVRELEKKHAQNRAEPPAPPLEAKRVADLALRLEQFPTEVLESPSEMVVKTVPLRVVKMACRGLPGSPDEKFTAYFPVKSTPGAGLARYLTKGMRIRINTEPAGLNQHLVAPDFREGKLQTSLWVTTFDHDEVQLKRMHTIEREVFARLAPGDVLKSPSGLKIGNDIIPFYFYGGDWSLYRQDAEEKVLRDEPRRPRRSILNFHRLMKKKGIQLFFVPVPQSASLFPDTALGVSDGMTLQRPSGNAPVSKLLEVLQKEGVNVVDLTKHLRSSRFVTINGIDHPISRNNDSHWSPAGAMLAAQRIAECVEATGALAGRPRLTPEDFVVQKEIHSWPGDLNFLPTLKYPGLQLPPASIPLFIVSLRDGRTEEMLASTCPSADVHLIGDSNSTAYISSHAGVHAHLVRALGTRVNLVAMDGSATLGSPDWWLKHFGDGQAKVVIWAVAERFLVEDIAWSNFSGTTP